MKKLKYCLPVLCCTSAILLSLQGCAQNSAKPGAAASLKDSSYQAWANGNLSRSMRKHTKPDETGAYSTLWDRLFDRYALPTFEHEAIDREVAWFMNHPDYIERVQERAGPFLHSIVEQFEENGIPGEIALLPVVESAFRPAAYSPKDAAGLWQFIPSTGKLYGLKQNRFYDGRRDVHESTQAAIKYLKKLNNDFGGDWLLALAAYNAGEGTVSRAIKRNQDENKPTDFWSLSLPQETKTYVPRLLAVARLFANSDEYELSLRDIPNRPLLENVDVDTRIDLRMAATMADISVEELKSLNPGLNHTHIGPESAQHLLIPIEKIGQFREQLARLDEGASIPGWSGGESLASMVHQLEETPLPVPTKSGKLSPSKLRAGTRLLAKAPVKPDYEASLKDFETQLALAPTRAGPKKAGYVVRKGDTLASVAKKHAISPDKLMQWNHFSSANAKLKPGKSLLVWTYPRESAGQPLCTAKQPEGCRAELVRHENVASVKKEKPAPMQAKAEARKVETAKPTTVAAKVDTKRDAPNLPVISRTDTARGKSKSGEKITKTDFRPVQYTIKSGDSLRTIALRFNVNVDDLRKWNTVKDVKGLQPGQVLTVKHTT